MKRKIVVVTTLFLLVIPNFSKPLLANPAVLAPAGELCSTGAGCIVVGTALIGGGLFLILKDIKTGLEYRAPVHYDNSSVANAMMKLPRNEFNRTKYFVEFINYADTQPECRRWFQNLTQNLPFAGNWKLIVDQQDDPDDPTGRKKDYSCRARLNTQMRIFNEYPRNQRTGTRRRRDR